MTHRHPRTSNRRGPGKTSLRLLFLLVLLGLGWGLVPAEAAAQAASAPGSAQMRHFWHVFAAYALAWGFIFGWVVTIVRRLRKLEERLPDR
jgi:CcmD family protein